MDYLLVDDNLSFHILVNNIFSLCAIILLLNKIMWDGVTEKIPENETQMI